MKVPGCSAFVCPSSLAIGTNPWQSLEAGVFTGEALRWGGVSQWGAEGHVTQPRFIHLLKQRVGSGTGSETYGKESHPAAGGGAQPRTGRAASA